MNKIALAVVTAILLAIPANAGPVAAVKKVAHVAVSAAKSAGDLSRAELLFVKAAAEVQVALLLLTAEDFHNRLSF